MIIFIFYILVCFRAEETLFPPKKAKSKCSKVEASDFQKLFEQSTFFIGANNSDDFNNTVSLDYDVIEINSTLDFFLQDVKVINTIKTKNYDSFQNFELCSFIQNQASKNYFIRCISVENNYINLELKLEKNIHEILNVENIECIDMKFLEEKFYILCQYLRDYLIISLDYKTGKIVQKYSVNLTDSQFTNCLIKYQVIKGDIQIALCCCDDWKIFNIPNPKQKILDKNLIYNHYNKSKILLNVKFLQHSLLLMFNDGILEYHDSSKTFIFNSRENYNDVINFNLCSNIQQLTSYALNQYEIYNQSVHSISRIQMLQQQMQNDYYNVREIHPINNKQFVLLYEKRIEFIWDKLINQSISIELQQIITIQNSNIFYAINKLNQLVIIHISNLRQYYPYKENYFHKYVLLFKEDRTSENLTFTSCLEVQPIQKNHSIYINQNHLNDTDQLQLHLQSSPNQITVKLYKNEINSDLPFHLSIHNNQSDYDVIQEYIFQNDCNLVKYFPNMTAFFVIQREKISPTYYIIFEGLNNTLVIFDCLTEIYQTHKINFVGNTESVFINSMIFILDRSRTKLYSISSEKSQGLELQFLYEFQEQMQFIQDEQFKSYFIQLFAKNTIIAYQLIFFLEKQQFELTKIVLKNSCSNIEKIIGLEKQYFFIQCEKQILFMQNQIIIQILYQELYLIDTACIFYKDLFSFCIIVGLSKTSNMIYKYYLNQFEVILLSQFILSDYVCIQDFRVLKQSEKNLILMNAIGQKNQKFLLFFTYQFYGAIQLSSVIKCGNYFSDINEDYIYYFDQSFQLMMFDHKKFKIVLKQEQKQQFFEQVVLQLYFCQLSYENKSESLIQNVTFYIQKDQKVIQKNKNFTSLFKESRLKLNIRDIFLGFIQNIKPINTSNEFKLLSPYRQQLIINCNQTIGIYCVFVQGDTYSFYNIQTLEIVYLSHQNNQSFQIISFQNIMNSDKFVIAKNCNCQNSTSSIGMFQLVDSHLQQINTLVLNYSLSNVFLAQNVLMIVTVNRTYLYLIEDRPIQLMVLENNFGSQILWLNYNTYIFTQVNQSSFVINLFMIEDSELYFIQYYNIPVESLENVVHRDFSYPKKISYQTVTIVNQTQDEESQILELFISDRSQYIFWIFLKFNISDGNITFTVRNIFDNMHINNKKIQLFKVNSNYLVINYFFTQIFRLQDGSENVPPIQQIQSNSSTTIFQLNTTHVAKSMQNENGSNFEIVTISEWELIMTKDFKQCVDYQVILQGYNPFQTINQTLIFNQKANQYQLINIYTIIILVCLLLMIVFLYIRKRTFLIKQQQQRTNFNKI